MPDEVSKRSRRSGRIEGPSPGRSPASGRGRGRRPSPDRTVRRGRVAVIRGPAGRRRARRSGPGPTATRSTVPSRGDRSSFCIFIASTASSCWPAVTASPGVTATVTTRPGMMARTSVGPCRAGARRALVARARRAARSASSTSKLEPPAVHDDLEPAGSIGRTRAGDRARRRRRPPRGLTRAPGPPVGFDLAQRPRPVSRSRTSAALHRGHRSIDVRSARRRSQPEASVAAAGEAVAAPARETTVQARPPLRPGPPAPRSLARSAGPSQRSPTQSVEMSAARKDGVPGDPAMERQRGLDPGDLGLVEGAAQPVDGAGPVRGMDHDLGDEVVVLGRDPVPLDRPVSTRTPGAGRHRSSDRTGPGVGAKSRHGSSAVRRTSIAWLAGSAARSAAASAAADRGRPPRGRTARARCPGR